MSEPLVLFQCTPLSCRLTASSCAARYAEANGGPSPGHMRPVGTACVACPVGKAHRAGEAPELWPDGSPIVRLGVTPRPSAAVAPTRPSWTPVRVGKKPRAGGVLALETKETPMPAARMIEWNGETKSLSDWARHLGVDPNTVRGRVDRGCNPDGSLTKSLAVPAPRPKRVPKVAKHTRAANNTVAAELDAIASAGGEKAFDPLEFLRDLGHDIRSAGTAANGVEVLLYRRGASSTKQPRLVTAGPHAI